MNYRKITATHAETRLYGNIGGWFANGDTFTSFLEDLESKGFTDLTIRMHCYGGNVFEGNVMSNAMERTNLKITIIIDGVAASMGIYILPSIAQENVFIAANAFGMVHRPASGESGDADAHLAAAKLLRDMEGTFIKVLAQRTTLSAEEIKTKWLDGKDHWLNAQEMVDFGFAKKIVPASAKNIKALDKEILQTMTPETMYDRYAAVLDKDSINNKNNNIMNLALIIASFALEGVTAESSETAVLAALTAKFKTLTDAVAKLEGDAKAKGTADIKALLDGAQTAGKFVASVGQTIETVRATYQTIGETAGVETLKTVLAGMGTKAPIASMIKVESKGTPAAGVQNWDWYQKNDPSALEAMQTENPDQFKELYKAEYGTYPA